MIFLSYIKGKWKIISMLLLFIAVFSLVFYLAEFSYKLLAYPVLICAVIGLLFLLYDYHLFVRRKKCIDKFLENNGVDLGYLNENRDLFSSDILGLIHMLTRNNQSLVSSMNTERTDLMDYYTIWAHQIKTPISAMDLVLQQDNSEQTVILKQKLFEIDQYVDMMMQYMRLESISNDFKFESCDIDEMIRDAVKKYAPIFILKKIKLSFQESHEMVVTDKKWTGFVIEQLLSNALKYTNSGEIKIAFAHKTLRISDSGIGIRMEDLPRIFENGFTGYNGRIGKKSSGIGLYLCNKIIAKLSYIIRITSVLDEGTTAEIIFEKTQDKR